MDEKKAKDGRIRVEVDPLKIKLIYGTFPEYKKDREVTRVIDDLMTDYLDKHPLMKMGCERERTFIDSLNKKNKEKQKKKFSTEQLERFFNNFWLAYRSSPKGVSSASKKKADEEFKKAINQRNADPLILIEAAQKAVKDQKAQIAATGDCLCLPDAFRWLRDDMWESLMESITVKQQIQNTGIQIYD